MENFSRSISKFISLAAGEAVEADLKAYYFEVPEGFVRPSIYFPAMSVGSRPKTLNSFEFLFEWKIKFFDKNNQSALNTAFYVMQKILENKNCIPLLESDGRESGEYLRLQEPKIQALQDGACNLILKWSGFSEYEKEAETGDKAALFYSDISKKQRL